LPDATSQQHEATPEIRGGEFSEKRASFLKKSASFFSKVGTF
jgi:hypothetical protein